MNTKTVAEDQRKRTLDALERRFAVAKAELLQQQKKSQKQRPNDEASKENNNITSSSSVASLTPAPAPITPLLNSSAKKDMEEDGPAYSQLSYPVHENLLTTNVKFQSKRGSMVDMILHELLQHGDSAQKYLQGSRSKKIDNWILLDNYVQGRGKPTNSHIRALRTHSKRSKKHMSMKQHKKCGSFYLPQDLQKFDVFKPMHEMWKGYMTQLLKNNGRNQLAQCLLSADLHGAIILVADCKIVSFTGVSGIMIRETAETFGIITQDDKFRVVPKKYSIFIFQVDCWKITLQGDKLTSRNLGL
ncbi:ribonuclease P protein subunit p29 isoform X2 [Jatropha curcas]|uniref:ribonuclease P protein subunit p29 isoform X2 n=1 Tax=Jatropha curcas TaxID=180498 RepID=UPI0005FB51AB|nr:ribonuclease P protein subunit p29 isoform X2 [Jatropha curcas]